MYVVTTCDFFQGDNRSNMSHKKPLKLSQVHAEPQLLSQLELYKYSSQFSQFEAREIKREREVGTEKKDIIL